MGDVRPAVTWGRAEREALDRCLSTAVPRPFVRPPPVRPFRLARMIETEIIPRLMLAHQAGAAPAEPGSDISSADVGSFTRMVLEGPADEPFKAVTAFHAGGIPADSLLLDLLAPTARLLGDMWRADLCSFAEVSIGLSRLQQVLREFSARLEMEAPPAEPCGQILLASTPGEQHTFGVSMLESFFRRAGWDVYGGSAHGFEEALEIASEVRLDAIGLSLSADVLFPRACSAIAALKAASRNPSVFVLVGGRFFCDHPDRVAEAGGDAAAADAHEALWLASLGRGAKLASC